MGVLDFPQGLKLIGLVSLHRPLAQHCRCVRWSEAVGVDSVSSEQAKLGVGRRFPLDFQKADCLGTTPVRLLQKSRPQTVKWMAGSEILLGRPES